MLSVYDADYIIWGCALYFPYLAVLCVSPVSALMKILAEYLESHLPTETYKTSHLKYICPFHYTLKFLVLFIAFRLLFDLGRCLKRKTSVFPCTAAGSPKDSVANA